MDTPLRVLILEDRPADAELMAEELRQSGLAPEWRRVSTERDYLAGLDPSLDVILADHSLPQFDAVRALQRLQERGLDVPFLIVSGMIGEELAVSLMKKGAADYVCKDRLGRLGAAVLRALERKRLQNDKQLAEQRLHASERRFRALIEHSADGMALFSPQAIILYSSPSSLHILGYAPEEFVGRKLFDLVHPDDLASSQTQFDSLLKNPGGVVSATQRVLHNDGSWRWVEWVGTNLLAESDVQAIVVNYRDITERQRADERLRKLSRAIEQSPVMVLITDAQGALEYVNPRFSAVTGYTSTKCAVRIRESSSSGRRRARHTGGSGRPSRRGASGAGSSKTRRRTASSTGDRCRSRRYSTSRASSPTSSASRKTSPSGSESKRRFARQRRRRRRPAGRRASSWPTSATRSAPP